MKNVILIIDDVVESRSFLRIALQSQFNILEAENGYEGIQIATKHIPDAIVCNIAMREMDGVEVCRRLKSRRATFHIPIILLTPNTPVQSIVTGLESGADDYMAKPFHAEILLAKIKTHIHIREKFNIRHLEKTNNNVDFLIEDDIREQFLYKIERTINQHISDREFRVDTLAFHLGISTSALYRKVHAFTGLSVNEFIKNIRMRHAFRLVESRRYTVIEVASLVGYEDAKYFSREFKKKYGRLPSEIARNAVKKNDIFS